MTPTPLPWIALSLCGALLAGCAGQRDGGPDADDERLSYVQPRYRLLWAGGWDEAEWDEARDLADLDEIVLERTACFGPCPVYRVTFRRDGTASFHGEENALRLGDFTGQIHVADYGKLCLFIRDQGIRDLAEDYSGTWTDDATTLVELADRRGKRIVISDYGSQGPLSLFAVQNMIDGLAAGIDWEAAPAAGEAEAEAPKDPIPGQ